MKIEDFHGVWVFGVWGYGLGLRPAWETGMSVNKKMGIGL